MGSYSPVPGFDDAEVEELADVVHRPIVEAMANRGIPYRGVLYAGLMMTADGPKVLEFNCRFGDPETQAVLPRLRSDLLDLCLGSREPGGLAGAEAEFADDWAVTVVLASAGYPASSSKGDVITGLERGRGGRGGRDHPRGHRRGRRGDRHGRGTGAERDRSGADAPQTPGIAPTMPPSESTSRGCRCDATSQPAP